MFNTSALLTNISASQILRKPDFAPTWWMDTVQCGRWPGHRSCLHHADGLRRRFGRGVSSGARQGGRDFTEATRRAGPCGSGLVLSRSLSFSHHPMPSCGWPAARFSIPPIRVLACFGAEDLRAQSISLSAEGQSTSVDEADPYGRDTAADDDGPSGRAWRQWLRDVRTLPANSFLHRIVSNRQRRSIFKADRGDPRPHWRSAKRPGSV